MKGKQKLEALVASHHASARTLLDSDLLFSHVGILAVVSVDISYFLPEFIGAKQSS